ncbi:MAG: hypothetical protein ACP5C3_06460 [Methanomicrobiales archaeon]
MGNYGEIKIYFIFAIMVLIILLSSINYFNWVDEDLNKGNLTFKVIPNEMKYGAVLKDGPYGNTSSDVKIAYIIGVHPLESKAHHAVLETIKNEDKSLKYNYYIYRVIVTKDKVDYNKGRMNGQILASLYSVPDIKRSDYDLAVDVHSNRGFYKEKLFIFSPVKSTKSERIARKIKDKISWLTYYVPPLLPEPTSGPYVTVPLINSGTNAVVYEVYEYDSYSTILNYAKDFIINVDQLNLKD